MDDKEQGSARRERVRARQAAYQASLHLTDDERRYFPSEITDALEALERLAVRIEGLEGFDEYPRRIRGAKRGIEQLAVRITRQEAKRASP